MPVKKHTSHRTKEMPAELSLREYAEILYRWKYVVLLSTIVVFSGVSLYTFLGDFIYEATAIVQIGTKSNPESMIPSFDMLGMGTTRNLMKEIGILKSRPIAEDVVALLREKPVATIGSTDTLEILERSENEPAYAKFSSDETIIGRLEAVAVFEPNNASDVIYISAYSTSPKEASIIANTFATVYYENNLNASRKQLRTTREFLEKILADKKSAYDAVEDSLRRYMESVGSEEQGQYTINALASLDARLDETDIEIQTTKSLLANYQRRHAELKATLPKNTENLIDNDTKRINDLLMNMELQKILEKISQLEVRRDVIKEQNVSVSDRTLINKKVTEIESQIAELRIRLQGKIGGESSGIQKRTMDVMDVVKDLNGKILDAQVRLQSLEVKKIALEDNRIVNEERFKEIPKRNVEYARLQRTKMTLEKVYVTVEEKYQVALVAEQSQFGYVEILQHAIPPATWVSPNIPKNLGFGFLIGLVIGVSLTFLINNFDDRIHKPEDVKKLGISVLTVVPVMDEQGRNIRGRLYRPTSAVTGERGTIRRELISEEGEALVAEDSIHPRLIAAINPYSRIADAYRRLRTSVQYWKQDVQVKSILVCSGAPQEGKSLTSANLAIVMAQSEKKVLLVDLDLRRPTVHELFNLKLEPGITEVLFGETDLHSAIRPTFVDNLDILPCGSIPLNPAELINSPAMKNIKEELEKEYDVIIFDSAPILLFTDAELLVSMVDSVVFVVKAESTQMNNLEHAIDIIEGIRMNLVGVVVNHYVLNRLHRGYYHLHGDYYYQQKYSPDGKKS